MSNDIHDKFDRARAYAEQKAEDAARLLRENSAKAADHLGTARESAGEAYERSRKKAEDLYEQAKDGTQRARTFVSEHPLASVAGAIAVGAAVAFLFPKGRAAVKALPKVAGLIGAEALVAVEKAKDAVEESGIADRAAGVTAAAKAAAGEAAAAAKAAAGQAADAARDIIHKATRK